MENKRGFADKYFLEKIYLSGYKSIQQTEIELKSNFNIIIGKNGAGKTNFMEFLNKVLNDDVNDLYEFESVLNFIGEKKIQINATKKVPKHTVDKKRFIVNEDLDFTFSIDGEIRTYKTNDYSEMASQSDFSRSSSLVNHGVPADYKFVEKPVKLSVDSGEWPGNQVSDISVKQPYFVNGLYYSFLFDDTDFNLISLNRKFSKQDVKDHLSATIFKEVEGIRNYLQGTSPITNIRFNENYNILGNDGIGKFTIENLFIEYEVNQEWYSFDNLSDGTKRLLYIISEIAFPDCYYFRSLSFGETVDRFNSRIILIEEPELGIHPHQFHKLMIFLKEQSQTKQIIITTHSPEALDILYEDELDSIILSEYDQKKGTLLRHMTDDEKAKAKRYMKEDFLSDYWMHSNLEPAN